MISNPSQIIRVLLTLAAVLPAEAAELKSTSAFSESWVVRSWQTMDGLPQNTVNALAQTRDGFLWVGTSAGLARFDGVRFRAFGLQDGLRSVHITALLEDQAGILWVGTSGGGLSRWENGRLTPLALTDEFAWADVIALAASPDDTLWVGTPQGLRRLRDGVWSKVGPAEGLPATQIRALLQDSKGVLWVSVLMDGLFQSSSNRFVPVQGTPTAPTDAYSLLEDREGCIWAGAHDGLLWRGSEGGWKLYDPTNGLPADNIESLAQGAHGTLWVGTRNSGLYFYSDEGFDRLTPRSGLSGNNGHTLCVDREGAVWVGTTGEGLNRLTPRLLRHWGEAEGLTQPKISSLAEDASGCIWAGKPSGGIWLFQDRRFAKLKDPAVSGNYPYFYSALAAEDGSVWMGGEQCLFRFRAGQPTEPYLEAPIRGEAIRAMCADGTNLWVGTYYSTLLKFETNGFRVVATNGSFAGGITSLVREAPDTLWIGTSGGLYHWENGTARRWTTRDGLLTPSVRALHRDLDGTLWVGTLGGGLARLKDGHIANITAKQGLIDDVISQIVPDDFGRLWLGCNHGIMRVERKELDDAADGRASYVHAIAFGQNEGMLQEQCSGGYSPTAIKTREGRLLFPTVRGIVEIDPALKLDSPNAIPQASIEDLMVDGQSRGPSGPVSIAPGRHHLEVNYTAPSLDGVGRVRFRQRLEPVEKEWINVGSRRTASYANLAPGQYAFSVTACDSTGVWGTTGASLAFTVLPHYWETEWFRLGSGLLLIALGGTSAWSWSRREVARARERERVAVEMRQLREELAHSSRVSTLGQLAASVAHELNQPLGAILANAEAAELFLQQDPPALGDLRAILADIRKDDERAGEVIRRMRGLLRKRELERQPLEINSLVEDVLQLVSGDATLRGVSLTADLGPFLPKVAGDRVHLQQVLLNLIINGMDAMAGQPQERRRISVQTRSGADAHVGLAVIDSGSGVEPDKLPRLFEPFYTTKPTGMGMGLSIARTIIEAHGGRIWAENCAEGGAVFRIELPTGGK